MKTGAILRRLAFFAALGFLLLEVLLHVFVLPNRSFVWRPLPPFGALTNELQHDWVARQRAMGPAGEEAGIGVFDPALGWCVRESSSTAGGNAHINALGARSTREFTPKPLAEMTRIVCFGESFTFAEEVEDADSWPTVLDSLAEGVEVLNFGVGGYGTDQALLRFRRDAPAGRIDALLVGVLTENPGRNVNRYRPLWYPRADSPVAKPRFVLGGDGLQLVPLPFGDRAQLLDAIESGSVIAELSEHEYWSPGLPRWLGWSASLRLAAGRSAYRARNPERLYEARGEPLLVTLEILAAFAKEAAERGIPRFLVLIFPTRPDAERKLARGARYWTPLVEALDERGIANLDLSDAILASQGDGPVPYLESHLDPRGNRAVARAVADELDRVATLDGSTRAFR